VGFLKRRRRQTEADVLSALADAVPHQRGDDWSEQQDMPAYGSDLGWYAPQSAHSDRFVGPDGLPALHLIPRQDTGGELELQLCEDATGLLIGPGDSRLPRAGVYVSQLRGQAFHRLGCTAGDFRPGAPLRLVREPDNEFDPDAVAVYDRTGRHLAAYVNNQKARILARLIDSGEPIEAVSIRGTGPGLPCDHVAMVAASPGVLRRLLEPRPPYLPVPVA
jgi:HIRAN domain-containing protein